MKTAPIELAQSARRIWKACAMCGSGDYQIRVIREPGRSFDKASREYRTSPVTIDNVAALCDACAERADAANADREARKKAAKQAKKERARATPPLFADPRWMEQKR